MQQSSKPKGNSNWDWEIKPDTEWFAWKFSELWLYRDLLFRLVRRDLLIHHQQTLLGPLWIVIQPLLMLLTFVLIFDRAVGLSTDSIPAPLFYLSGIIVWNFFSDSFSGTAFTFTQHAPLFGKVYFPRLIIPLSVILMNIIRLGIQLIVFVLFILWYWWFYDFYISDWLWLPALMCMVFLVSGISLGLGLFFSVLTAKYRDLGNMVQLGVRLLMFATPIFYPLSVIDVEIRNIVMLNPLVSIIEFLRFGFFGQGNFTGVQLVYSFGFMCGTLLLGTLLFNKFGSKLQDVV